MKTTIAYDISTKSTGYAIFHDGVLNSYGLITSSSKDIVPRLDELSKKVSAQIVQYKPDEIVIERFIPFLNRNTTANTLNLLSAANHLVQLIAYQNNIPVITIPVQTIRSRLTKIYNRSNEPIKRIEKHQMPEILQSITKEPFPYIRNRKGNIDKSSYDIADAMAVGYAHLLK